MEPNEPTAVYTNIVALQRPVSDNDVVHVLREVV
jgi:hypothetical protein